jgi:sirohydrochlorin cobaltochelatase
MSSGLILFAHGARDPRWLEPFDAIAAAVRSRAPAIDVRLAFLELIAPNLTTVAEAMVSDGCKRIDILPLFLGTGGHLRRDLPPLVEAIKARHASVSIVLHPAAG